MGGSGKPSSCHATTACLRLPWLDGIGDVASAMAFLSRVVLIEEPI